MLLYGAAWMHFANIGVHHKLAKSFLSILNMMDHLFRVCLNENNTRWVF